MGTWGDWAEWGGCTVRCGEGKRMRRRHLELTLAPSAPPAPMQELMGMYSELSQQTEAIHAHRLQELLLAFTCGFLSFIVALFGIRVFLTVRARAHGERIVNCHWQEDAPNKLSSLEDAACSEFDRAHHRSDELNAANAVELPLIA